MKGLGKDNDTLILSGIEPVNPDAKQQLSWSRIIDPDVSMKPAEVRVVNEDPFLRKSSKSDDDLRKNHDDKSSPKSMINRSETSSLRSDSSI